MPIDGGTGNVEVKVSDNVAPLTVDVVTINQTEPICVTFAVLETRLADIKRYSTAGRLPVTARPQDGSDELEQGILRSSILPGTPPPERGHHHWNHQAQRHFSK